MRLAAGSVMSPKSVRSFAGMRLPHHQGGHTRPVTLVGINFNPQKRNIDLPIIEAL